MTKDQMQKTIDWLKDFVWRMEDRFDGDKLKEQIDRLKKEIQRLEDRLENHPPSGDPVE